MAHIAARDFHPTGPELPLVDDANDLDAFGVHRRGWWAGCPISRDARDSWANSPPPSGASGSLSWERVREALGRYRGAKTPSPREGVALGLVETKDEADAAPPV